MTFLLARQHPYGNNAASDEQQKADPEGDARPAWGGFILVDGGLRGRHLDIPSDIDFTVAPILRRKRICHNAIFCHGMI
jgi:hypothetical protein